MKAVAAIGVTLLLLSSCSSRNEEVSENKISVAAERLEQLTDQEVSKVIAEINAEANASQADQPQPAGNKQ